MSVVDLNLLARQATVPRSMLVILFVVTICLRALGVMARHEYVMPVHVGAEAGVMAEHVVHGEGFASPYDDSAKPSPSTHLPPAYVYMLAGMLKMGMNWWDIYRICLVINLVFGGMLPVVTVLIGEAAGFPAMVSMLSGLLMIFCPEAFRATGLVWDEAIFTTLIAAFIWWMLWRLSRGARMRDAVWMGLASGLLALLNPAMVLALPLSWMAGLWAKRAEWKRVIVHGVIFAGMTFVGALPWNIRNWFLIEPPAYVFVRGPFWLATWTSLHPIERKMLPDGRVEKTPLHPWNGTERMEKVVDGKAVKLTEAEYFEYCKQRVLAAYRADPGFFFRHVLTQMDSFWLGEAEARRWYVNPLPFFLAQGVPAIAGVVGLILARRRMAGFVQGVFWAMLLVFPVPYYLADASMRYRHPIDVVLYIGIAWGMWEVGRKMAENRLIRGVTSNR